MVNRKIIIDCDNTFSLDGCDIDDGLAIIYALAQKDTQVLGINTTFGNNTVDLVYSNTLTFMKNIGYPEMPVYKGSVDSYEENEAAKFLVAMAEKHNGELDILTMGSLTNLYHAWQMDHNFYEKIRTISLMGGITGPLIINRKILNELNFSCNVQASLNVLEHGKSMIIATGNTCLDGFFTRKRFEKLQQGNAFEQWLYRESIYWFDREYNVFENEGMYIWDIVSAAALLNPELFIEKRRRISPDEKSMKQGLLFGNGKSREVIIPKIKEYDAYIEHVYEQFKEFGKVLAESIN